MFATLLFVMLAPAPFIVKKQPSVPPGLQVTDGAWTMMWAGQEWHYSLGVQGEAKFSTGHLNAQCWVGTCKWCPRTRVLSVDEANQNGYRIKWSAKLCENLEGEAMIEGRQQTARVKLFKPLFKIR